ASRVGPPYIEGSRATFSFVTRGTGLCKDDQSLPGRRKEQPRNEPRRSGRGCGEAGYRAELRRIEATPRSIPKRGCIGSRYWPIGGLLGGGNARGDGGRTRGRLGVGPVRPVSPPHQ